MLFCFMYSSSVPFKMQVTELDPYEPPEPEMFEPEQIMPPRRVVPEQFRIMFDMAAAGYGTPVEILESVAWVESKFNPYALSPERADGYCDMGMFQINSQFLDWFMQRYGDFDPLDPGAAIKVAALHLNWLYGKYRNWYNVILAYNAGITGFETGNIPESSYTYAALVFGETEN